MKLQVGDIICHKSLGHGIILGKRKKNIPNQWSIIDVHYFNQPYKSYVIIGIY